MASFPLPFEKHKDIFPDIYCENLVKLLEVKHKNVGGGVLGVFDSNLSTLSL